MAFISSIFTRLFTSVANPSFLSVFVSWWSYIWKWLGNKLLQLLNFIIELAWTIVKFVLGVMEAFEYIINSFLGIGVGPTEILDQAQRLNFLDTLVIVFKALFGVAIVLLILFTIFAIIKQEIQHAQNGFENSDKGSGGNDKKSIIMRLFKSLMGMILLPLCMIFILVGVSAALTSFNNALKGPNNPTIASQVLASSTYDANRFRKYANANKRMPIIIEAYDAEDYDADNNAELAYKIKSGQVQNTLINTALAISENNFLPFAKTVTYKNNKLTNSSNFGSFYENFICTAEQYQVMADFIDFAQMTGTTYYIKAMDEKDIEWKYVDSSIYNAEDNSLTIKYRDASDIDGDGNTSDTYEITYKMSYNVTSPISDALKSIMAMLGIGEYSDNLYKIMERDEDFLNVVKWSNEKVLIKFSENFDETKPETWTHSDQIIIYEFYHFSSNNTFAKYSLSDLKKGVELDALKINYRDYYPEAAAYSPERTLYGVLINGTYYNTVKSTKDRDSYGNFYYELKTYDDVEFLRDTFTTINVVESANVNLSLSNGFNINKTSTWTYTDEILIYEFYKDLSYMNTLRKDPYANKYLTFSDYDYVNGGVKFPVYKISTKSIANGAEQTSGYYLLLNGTYYALNNVNGNYYLFGGAVGEHFLTEAAAEAFIVYDYNFNFNKVNANVTGIDGGDNSANSFIYNSSATSNERDLNEAELAKFGNFTLSFTPTFDYKDPSTWTYRDYFLFYVYAKYLGIANSMDELKYSSLNGELRSVTGSVNLTSGSGQEYFSNKVVLAIDYGTGSNYKRLYFDIEGINNISTLKIVTEISHTQTEIMNNTSFDGQDLFVGLVEGSSLYNAETEFKNFNFSSRFDESSLETWTTGDLMLVALIRAGYLSSVTDIALDNRGYNALVYKLNGKNYYRFSKGAGNFGNNVIYLSEANVLSMRFYDVNNQTIKFSTLEEWLDMSAIDFVAKLYGATSSDLTTDFNGISNSLYSEISSSVYNISQIIDELLNNNGYVINKGDAFEIYDEISTYTYTNSSFDFYDITSWTALDAAIYYITGSAVGTYSSYVIKKGNDLYFVVGNKAIKISNGNFGASIADNNIIVSSKSSYYSSNRPNFNSVAKNDYANLLFEESVFEDENGNSTLSYYKSSNFSYSYPSTTPANYNYDILEIILRGFGISGSQTFKIYTDGLDFYIKAKDNTTNKFYYILVAEGSTSSPIRFTENSTLSLNSSILNKKLFHRTGSYNAFAGVNADSLSTSTFTYLDSLIFNLTGNKNNTNYDIYSIINADGTDGKSYILIQNGRSVRFVEVKASDMTNYSVAQKQSAFSTNEHLKYLYDYYYSSIVKTPGDLNSESVIEATYVSNFSISDINTWTPINVVLYSLGLINDGSSNVNVLGEYITSSSSASKYLRITVTLDNGNEENYYILLNDVCYIQINEIEDADDTATLTDNNDAIINLYLQLFLAVDQTNGEYNDQNSYINRNYLTFNSNLDSLLQINSAAVNVSDLVTKINANATDSNFKAWTWFDLIYYKMFGAFRTNENFEIYADSNGKNFIRLEVNNSVKFVYINNVLLVAPENNAISASATGTTNYTFDLSSSGDFNNLGLIAYKLSNNKTGNVEFIKLPTAVNGSSYIFTDEIYYIQNSSDLNYYAIYNVDQFSLNVSQSEEELYFENFDYSNLINYNALDFLIKYLGSATDINSKVYTYGNSQFIKVGNEYINISKINLVYIESLSKKSLIIKGTENSAVPLSHKDMPKILSLTENNRKGAVLNTYTDNNFAPKLEAASNSTLNNFELKFSEGFKPYDYSTWTLADFMIYYFFKEGYFKDSRGNTITNFQQIVNSGSANAYIKYYVYFNGIGSATTVKVLQFGDEADEAELVNYNVFVNLYTRTLNHYNNIKTDNNIDVTLNIGVKPSADISPANISHFYLAVRTDLVSNNFVYDNYYFFTENKDELSDIDLFDVTDNQINAIVNGESTVSTVGKINLKLSSGFDIDNPDTWTIIDFIVIREASRSVNGNAFAGFNLNNLKESDNIIDVLATDSEKLSRLLFINGTVYNITSYISKFENNQFFVDAKINSESKIVENGSVDNYDKRFLSGSINFMVKSDLGLKESELKTPTTFSYVNKVDGADTTFYYSVDTRVFGNFKIDLDDTIKFPPAHLYISPVVRELNWPQKLMNDMFVIYPNLNWETLIATSGWIDTLGEFTSANTSGNIIESGNSANITAAGLVLSEFFLSIAKEKDYGFANFEYSSVFDAEVIKSLMLSLMGEENYKALVSQSEIFADMFNTSFAAILDDIAADTGIEILDGKVDNFTMSVYKAYLTTIMLSSDLAEYLYKIATRVYAQYTIYESLAYAGGDYAKYYAFINGLSDENGNTVTSFSYGSFYELVKYENSVIGNGTPTFTFNYRKVYRALIDENASDEEILASLNNQASFSRVYSKLDAEYNKVYANTSDNSISDNDDIYCFLLDVYWSTYKRLLKRGTNPKNFPDYITIYKQYLDGTIKRWASVEGVDATASVSQIRYYSIYKAQLLLQSFKLAGIILPIYGIDTSLNVFGAIEDIIDMGDRLINDRPGPTSTYSILKRTFANSSEYSRILNNVLQENPIEMIKTLKDSSDGDLEAWNKIVKLRDNVKLLLDEFGDVCSLSTGASNSNGSMKVEGIDDKDYNNAYDALTSMFNNLDSYYATQTKLDVITKSSITFMLEQFGQNYVTEGYSFNIENRKYTLTTASSTARIAEYVYGGSYLAKFGIEPTYTKPDSEGIIEALVAFDHNDGTAKIKLSSFKELRKFVTSLADYTAKLYYLSNFNDLAENISDGLLLTDYIYAKNPLDDNSNEQILVTPEFLILSYLVLEEDISPDTFIRLIVGDNERTLTNLGIYDDPAYSSITNLIKALGSDSLLSEMSEETKRKSLISYMRFVMSDIYSAYGYYNPGGESSSADRIHLIFKNVISYLITSEDESETVYENAAKLDKINFKQFKRLMMEKLADFTQNSNETAAENATRYIALFNLVSSQFNYFMTLGADKIRIGRTIAEEHLSRKLVNGIEMPIYDEVFNIFGEFKIDNASKNMVLSLAGIANRPIEELVNLEYDSLYDMNGNYDEAKGDTFIICTYDEAIGKYVPVLARDENFNGFASDSKYAQYRRDYADQKLYVTTSYYNDPSGKAVAQPIVAKGVLTADLKPTAIKMEDYKVSFYRTDITAAANLNDEALTMTRITQNTQTIGFTKFVDTATSTKVSGANSQINFIAQSNITSLIKSDASVYYMQLTNAYDCTTNGLNEFNVLDTFNYFYALGMMEYFLIALAFATIVPMLFKGCIAVVQRIFDLTFLTLIGPVVISTDSLNIGEDSKKKSLKIFEKWRNFMTQSLLQAFGIVVGFNVYYILMSSITGMTFVSDFTINKITAIGGFTFFSANFVNSIVKFLFIVMAAGVIRGAGNLLTQIITLGKVTDAFSSPISGDGFSNIKDVLGSVKKSFTNVKDAMTGKLLLEAKDAAIQTVKHSLPGSELVGKAVGAGKWLNNKRKDMALRKALEANGVSPSVAKKMVKQLRETENQIRKQKKINQANNANKFMERIGGQKFDVPKQKGEKGKGDKKGGGKGKGGKKSNKSSREQEFDKNDQENQEAPQKEKDEFSNEKPSNPSETPKNSSGNGSGNNSNGSNGQGGNNGGAGTNKGEANKGAAGESGAEKGEAGAQKGAGGAEGAEGADGAINPAAYAARHPIKTVKALIKESKEIEEHYKDPNNVFKKNGKGKSMAADPSKEEGKGDGNKGKSEKSDKGSGGDSGSGADGGGDSGK